VTDFFSKIKRITVSNLLEFSIWGIVFCLPFSKSLVEIFITVAIALTVFIKIKKRDFSFRKSPLTLAFILYFGINFLSLFWSANFMLTFRAIFSKVGECIVLFYVVYDFVDSKKKLKRLLCVVLFSVLLICINGLIQQYITGVDFLHGYRTFKYKSFAELQSYTIKEFIFDIPIAKKGYVTSSFPFPNDYSTWIIVFLPLAFTMSFFDLKEFSKKVRLVSYLALFLLVFSLFLTKTRAAWIACSMGLVFLSAVRSRKIILFLAATALVFYLIMPQHVKDAVGSNLSLKDRMGMWKVSVEIIKERPFLGSGLNTYFENYKRLRNDENKFKRGSYAHNCYLQQAGDIGIVGLFIFLYLLFCIFWFPLKKILRMTDSFYSSCALGIWAGLFSFSIHAFGDTNFYSLPLAVLFWFMTGVLFSVVDMYEKKI